MACPPPGDLPNPGIEPTSLRSPALEGGFFTTSTTWYIHMYWLVQGYVWATNTFTFMYVYRKESGRIYSKLLEQLQLGMELVESDEEGGYVFLVIMLAFFFNPICMHYFYN